MSIQIFKKDYQRIREELWYQRLHVVLDEAHCIKDIKTSNYKLYQEFINDTCAYPLEGHAESHRTHQLLTGTPLNKPLDAYAYIKLIAPIVYRSKGMFDQLHIAGLDSFGNPIGFKNLDLLTNNLMLSSVRHTKEDVLNLPPCTIQPIVYELDHKHKALYDKLANEQILKLGDGSKIDATQCMALFHSLQQIICQWDYFSQDPKLVSQAYRLIEETLEELGSKKLVVFANYRRTNQALVDRFKCPGVWGEVSPLQKQKALATFIEDDSCRMIALNAVSAGIGVDGLQDVCSEVLYVESPISLSHWTQSMSRIDRQGQKQPVTVRIGTALGTIQEYLLRSLTEKEELVNPLQGSRSLLRAAIYGESPTPG